MRVDLTNERIWTQSLSPEDYRQYLGGVGIGAKILYEEVPPDVPWDHPDNRLILATGPLAGLPVWGTGGLTVVTRGAMTNGTSTQANGFFERISNIPGTMPSSSRGRPAAGYTFISKMMTSSCAMPRSCWATDTWEMQDTLNAEHGLSGHQMSVYGIGPAGENLVRFAVIAGDYGHASKNGCGAVMGEEG